MLRVIVAKQGESRRHPLLLIFCFLLAFIAASLNFNNHSISNSKDQLLISFVGLQNGNTEDKRVSNNVSEAAASTRTYNTSTPDDRRPMTAHNHTHNTTSNATYLIIHVGPVKTGSSSIQCNLQGNPFLKLSSYDYLGRIERVCAAKHPRPLKKSSQYLNVQAFVFQYIVRGWLIQDQFQGYVKSFQQDMQRRQEQGIHTILAAEEFCGLVETDDSHWAEFAGLLNTIQQQVRFQVVYRHLFDWAVSLYTFMQTWNRKLSSFSEAPLQSILHKSVQSEAFEGTKGCSPYAIWSAFRSKGAAIGPVDVFNMHGEGDMPTRFLCSLPNAEAACEGSKELKFEVARPTDVDILHADRIATAGWESGVYFNSSKVRNKRKEIRKVIQDRVKNVLSSSFLDLPLECMGEEALQRLLEISIDHGKQMLGDAWDLDAMKAKFESHVAKRKFCSVNVTAVLEDPSWQAFLSSETLLRVEVR
jgi:hypothetical protein